MIRFIADENVDAPIIAFLRDKGLEVVSVQETMPGATDEEVLSLANERDAILVTFDRDFGVLVFQQHLTHAGVIYVRLSALSSEEKASVIHDAIWDHLEMLSGNFTVIGPRGVRIRRHIAQ